MEIGWDAGMSCGGEVNTPILGRGEVKSVGGGRVVCTSRGVKQFVILGDFLLPLSVGV